MADTGNFFLALPRPVETYHSETYARIAPANFDCNGKTLLITAGATGIGFAISEAFAEAGADRIVIISRSPGPQETAKKALESRFPKVSVETYSASITDAARMSEILSTIGAVDVLVLSAATTHNLASTGEIPTQEMEDTYNTNVIAPFNLIKAYLELSQPASRGSKTIINISSASAHLQIPTQAGYGSSKAAFVQIMQHFAAEHQPGDGVRLFSIHPGAFYTPFARTQFEEAAFPWEDIKLPAHFCLWLASPEADFLHGRFVWAHWDVDQLIALKDKIAKDPGFLKIGLVQ